MPEFIIFVLEIIGTIAFAVSGALVAISCSLDIFGVVFIGSVTAVGGGIVRDIILGRIPPAIFSNIHMFSIAAITSVIVFVIAYIYRYKFNALKFKIEHYNNIFDAVGLAAFSVMGTETALAEGFSDFAFLSISMGMITGIGGGIFRDILTDSTPYVLKKHVYACASIIGSISYYILRTYSNSLVLASVLSMVTVFLIRVFAAKYRWELPKIKFEDTNKENTEKWFNFAVSPSYTLLILLYSVGVMPIISTKFL